MNSLNNYTLGRGKIEAIVAFLLFVLLSWGGFALWGQFGSQDASDRFEHDVRLDRDPTGVYSTLMLFLTNLKDGKVSQAREMCTTNGQQDFDRWIPDLREGVDTALAEYEEVRKYYLGGQKIDFDASFRPIIFYPNDPQRAWVYGLGEWSVFPYSIYFTHDGKTWRVSGLDHTGSGE